MLGLDDGDRREVRILNKVIRMDSQGVYLEADPGHAEIVVRELGLEGCKTGKVPGSTVEAKKVAEELEKNEGERQLLDRTEARRYRAIAARLNYLATERPDIQFSVKEAARAMANPTREHWSLLVKLGRYLAGRPRMVLRFEMQDEAAAITTFSDSDWAACGSTRRSTSGGLMKIGKHPIKSWAKQQKVLALSSAEAETYGIVAATCESLGLQRFAADMGSNLAIEIYVDAIAARGIIQRSGLGKVRHLRTQALWLQEVETEQRASFHKVDGACNPADAMTKYMTEELMNQHMHRVPATFEEGRAESAPAIASITYQEIHGDYHQKEFIHEHEVIKEKKIIEDESINV